MENRNDLIAAAITTTADRHAERDAALLVLREQPKRRAKRITLGVDKADESSKLLRTEREFNVAVHVQENNKGQRLNLNGRITRHPAHDLSAHIPPQPVLVGIELVCQPWRCRPA